jgi:hypothetical protein
MTFPRTHLIPVLAIAAGGTVGALLTLGPLALRSPSNEVPAPDPVVVSS